MHGCTVDQVAAYFPLVEFYLHLPPYFFTKILDPEVESCRNIGEKLAIGQTNCPWYLDG